MQLLLQRFFAVLCLCDSLRFCANLIWPRDAKPPGHKVSTLLSLLPLPRVLALRFFLDGHALNAPRFVNDSLEQAANGGAIQRPRIDARYVSDDFALAIRRIDRQPKLALDSPKLYSALRASVE